MRIRALLCAVLAVIVLGTGMRYAGETLVLMGGICLQADTGEAAQMFTAYVDRQAPRCVVVKYHPDSVKALPAPAVYWIFAHEAGHIALDHGRIPFEIETPPWNATRRAAEMEADCYAAKTLKARGMVEDVADWMRNRKDQSLKPFYPSWAERVSILELCAG